MRIAAYGTWSSPLSASVLARGSVRYGFSSFGASGALYFSELRAAEQGRCALLRITAEAETEELLPAPYSARTRVYEYGGKSFLVSADETQLWFVNAADQQVYTRDRNGAISQLTAASELRFAELTQDSTRGRLLALAEQSAQDARAVEHFLAAIDLQTGAVQRLIEGRDFYAAPALSPDGRSLAYLAWDHPHMPWDAAELHVCSLNDAGQVTASRHVAGTAEACALQPTWSAHGQLYFGLEVSGQWALHQLDERGQPKQLAAVSGEVGAPLWQLGTRLWDFLDATTLAAVSFEDGQARLWHIDLARAETRLLSADYPYIGQLCAHAGAVVFSVGWAGAGSELVRISGKTGAAAILRSAHAGLLDEADTSTPQAVRYETSHGDTAHGFFYAPKNHAYTAPAGDKPPLIVLVHGGPTAGASATWSANVQYFTTRGFAVLDVNYRGSTGFGRAYRDRLRGEWGVLDVDDCVAGARYLAAQGHVDPTRLVIRGGSAGGYTVLQALANHAVFAAGSCHYGISDLEALTRDTHKFESHYDRFLIGPYPSHRDLYLARSPIHYVERIRKPVIFFQGLEDRVVPAAQTERMAKVLRENGIHADYHAYPGEQHGFRKAETIEHMLNTELSFLQNVLGLQTEGKL